MSISGSNSTDIGLADVPMLGGGTNSLTQIFSVKVQSYITTPFSDLCPDESPILYLDRFDLPDYERMSLQAP